MVQPKYELITRGSDESFHVKHIAEPNFPSPYHFHTELEIMHVIQSTGVRLVGDHIERFNPGDLVLMGPNLAHAWRNDPVYYDDVKQSSLSAEAFVIQFREDFWGGDFLFLPELKPVQQLIRRSQRGMKFRGNVRLKIADLIYSLENAQGTHRVILFLEVLGLMADTREYEYLSSEDEMLHQGQGKMDKLNRVYDYVIDNMNNDISLEEISGRLNMTKNSFCRFFKQSTGKTLTRFSNEIRVSHACRLLAEKRLSIKEVAFSSGFNNLSHFNEQFKAIKGEIPRRYREEV